MASTYSTSLKLTLIGDGDQAGIWGQTTNNNLGTLLEQAITGVQSITMADANYTLTNFNGVLNEARNAVLIVGGTNNAQRDLIPPLVKKLYTVVNNTIGGFAIRVIGASGTGVIIPNGATALVYCDGTNFVSGLSGTSGNFTVNGALTATSVSGNGVALTAINASNISSGTIANARTTATSANGASTIVGRDVNGNFSANVVTVNDLVAGNLVANGTTLTNINASNITSGTISNARTTGSSSNGASTIVLRGTSGEFSAGAITAVSISGDGSALTTINASNISSGTIANARTTASSSNGASTIVLRDTNGSFTANIITANGSALTAINASNISSGTVATARLGSGTANSSTFLRGDQTYALPSAITTTNFTIQQVGSALVFQYNGSNVAVMDSGGNLTSSGQFQAGGSV